MLLFVFYFYMLVSTHLRIDLLNSVIQTLWSYAIRCNIIRKTRTNFYRFSLRNAKTRMLLVSHRPYLSIFWLDDIQVRLLSHEIVVRSINVLLHAYMQRNGGYAFQRWWRDGRWQEWQDRWWWSSIAETRTTKLFSHNTRAAAYIFFIS